MPGQAAAEQACRLWQEAGARYKELGAEGALKLDERAAALAADAARESGDWTSFATAADEFATMVRLTTTSSGGSGTPQQGYDVTTRGLEARGELSDRCRALGVTVF